MNIKKFRHAGNLKAKIGDNLILFHLTLKCCLNVFWKNLKQYSISYNYFLSRVEIPFNP